MSKANFFKRLKTLILDSFLEFRKPKTLAFLGLMGALAIALKYTTSIDLGPYIKIGFSGIPNRVVDTFFGPVVGGIFGAAMDIIKFFIKPTGAFFPGFTFDAFLGAVIYGCFLYKKPVKFWRFLLAGFFVKLIVNCGFNTYWMTMLSGKAFMALLPLRLLKNAIMLPIDAAIQYLLISLISRINKRVNFL